MKFGTGSSASGGGEYLFQPNRAVSGTKYQIIDKPDFRIHHAVACYSV
jgi:hypothetical protein